MAETRLERAVYAEMSGGGSPTGKVADRVLALIDSPETLEAVANAFWKAESNNSERPRPAHGWWDTNAAIAVAALLAHLTGQVTE